MEIGERENDDDTVRKSNKGREEDWMREEGRRKGWDVVNGG